MMNHTEGIDKVEFIARKGQVFCIADIEVRIEAIKSQVFPASANGSIG